MIAIAVGGAIIAATVDSQATDHYSLWIAPGFFVSYVAAILALVCFIGAIREWPFPFARRPEPRANQRTISSEDRNAPDIKMKGFLLQQATLLPTEETLKHLQGLREQGRTLLASISDMADDSTKGVAKNVNHWRFAVSKELVGYPTQSEQFAAAGPRPDPPPLGFTTDTDLRTEMKGCLTVLDEIINGLCATP
jgi:hypothetical protein